MRYIDPEEILQILERLPDGWEEWKREAEQALEEVRAEGGEYVLHTSGATGTRLNGETINTPRQLQEGDRIEIGTAELTFRRTKLPLGVSVVDRAVSRPKLDDVDTRRTTIANPILGSHESEGRSKRWMVTLFVILVALALYYFLSR